MTKMTHALVAMLAFSLPANAMAEQNAVPKNACIAPNDAAAMMLFLAPEALKAAAITCAGVLPPTALLRQTSGPFIAKYQAAADSSWPGAKRAMVALGDPSMAPLLDSDQAKPMVTALLAPMIAKAIQPKDCESANHILTLMEPLPARNTADLIVTIVQLSETKRLASEEKVDLPICPGLPS